MHEIVSIYWDLRSLSQQLGDSIAADASVGHDEQPAAFFGMAFNGITLTIELLDFYYNTWAVQAATTCSSVEEAREQNAQRVILFQKMCLIELMSSLEFCAKHIVSGFSTGFGAFKGRLYLGKIMERSKEIGLIDANTLAQWKGLIEHRNCLIHNNGYASETSQYSYPGATLNFVDGAMTQGTIRDFTALTEWLLRASGEWVVGANNSFKPNPLRGSA
jgi:hypothetical protein